MGTQLQQILKSLCFDTEWKYAVFWKLKHRARMVLTWEEAYYESQNLAQHDQSKNKRFDETLNNSSDGHFSHDPLGLAVAKMSYHVYSLGEGIVGQVAATGKHQWIFWDNCVTNSLSSFEYGDGWQTQFSAGIRTVVVVAVVPHGVVQLGSINKVVEDLKLVNHIRGVFFSLQDSSLSHKYNPIRCSYNSFLHLPDISTRGSDADSLHECLQYKAINKERPIFWHSVVSSLDKHSNGSSCDVLLPGITQTKADEVFGKHGGSGLSMLGHEREMEGEVSGWSDVHEGVKHAVHPYVHHVFAENMSVYNFAYSADNKRVAFPYFSSDLLDSATCERVKFDDVDRCRDGRRHIKDPSEMQLLKGSEQLLQNEPSQTETSNASFVFSSGSELHAALGPAFLKQSNHDWEVEKAEVWTTTELPEEIGSSQLTLDSGSEHLLEAVVANIRCNSSDAKSDKSTCKSVQSLMTSESMTEISDHNKHTVLSGGHSIGPSSLGEVDAQHCLSSSGVCVRPSRGLSSTCPSTCSELAERSSEPVKTNKKRARPGENCRPRPRDRQLIQDRIKELRELVPNGSKCSIDSLLERTIKHMLFLQSTTKHADKLKKFSESKLHNKETDILGSSSYEQGSSWAVEVGSHLKVCTIIVENLNMNGLMLIEMMCEECSHFLEIAEAIKSLGLTILKGGTEAHSEKTWICFVVEGQNNRSMHRIDILWSLVQILQPKSIV